MAKTNLLFTTRLVITVTHLTPTQRIFRSSKCSLYPCTAVDGVIAIYQVGHIPPPRLEKKKRKPVGKALYSIKTTRKKKRLRTYQVYYIVAPIKVPRHTPKPGQNYPISILTPGQARPAHPRPSVANHVKTKKVQAYLKNTCISIRIYQVCNPLPAPPPALHRLP